MKIATIIARSLLGLIFVVFGSNMFLHFIPMPPLRWTPFLRPRDAIFKLAFFEAAQVVGLCRLHRASIHFGKREQRAKQPSSPSLPVVLVTSFLAPEAL